MDDNIQQRYASHVPVLKAMLPMWKNGLVLEFGCGEFSTPLFHDHAEYVLSIEQSSPDWLSWAKRENYMVIDHYYHQHKTGVPNKLPNIPMWDMVFVDGYIKVRRECVEWALKTTRLIIAHDAEQQVAGLYAIKPPKGWIRMDHKPKGLPHTAVWIKP